MGLKVTGSGLMTKLKRPWTSLTVRLNDAERDWTPFRPASTHTPNTSKVEAPAFCYESFFGSNENDPEQPPATDADDHRGTDASFESIPNEVLESIFAFCVEREPDKPMNTFDPYEAPWTLTKVNRRWRSIALTCESLWCNIIVQRPWGFRGYAVLPTKSMLRFILSRSKPLPLTIYFAPGDSVMLMQAMKDLLPPLSSCSPRWKDVHLELPHMSFLGALTRISGKLPLLERISIHVNRGLIPAGDQPTFRMFEVAPVLTHATTRGIKRVDQLPFPFSQLTEYDGAREDWATLLKAGGNLERCLIEFGPSDITAYPPIVHHRLKSLHISAACILHSMEIPSLTELTLYSRADMMHSRDLVTLISFIQRSCCRLERLEMQNVHIGGQEPLTTLLEHLPHLQFLRFEETYSVIRWYFLCTSLTIKDHVAPLVPCLEKLTLTTIPLNIMCNPPSPSALGQMLKSRFNASPTFVAVVSKSLLPLGVRSLDIEEGLIERLTIDESPSLTNSNVYAS